jgi:phosphomannomutase
MNINKGIFKAYDIRGLYPEDINDENISTIVAAIYSFYLKELKKESATIVLSRDMRVSSPSLHEKARETLLKLGAHILDIGIASTPTYYFAIINHQADCGIQISASHNPKEYNGLKLVRRDSKKIVKIGKGIGMEEITEMAMSGHSVPPKDGGEVEEIDSEVEAEVAASMKSVHAPDIQKFKIVADCANAMGAVYLEELFKHVPADLVRMNFTLDGTFPAHQADPAAV